MTSSNPENVVRFIIDERNYLNNMNMYQTNKKEMVEPKVGLTLTETKFGMKKVINGKTYNTETSKKVCGFDVNGWTHELYQTKSGEYFTYIFSEFLIYCWIKKHNDGDTKRDHYFTGEEIKLVSENEVRHMMERSGVEGMDRKETNLTELKDYFSEDGVMSLKVTGKCGVVTFDFGTWEVIVDVDDEHWVRMTSKGKVDFDEDDLNEMEWIRNRREMVREEYLKGRFGEC